jgi:hypothetical protein
MRGRVISAVVAAATASTIAIVALDWDAGLKVVSY